MGIWHEGVISSGGPDSIAPVAGFASVGATGQAPLTVNFYSYITGPGTVTSYAWDFNNDGITDSTDKNPMYTYTNGGTYTVKLTVTGPGGSDTVVKDNLITASIAGIDLSVPSSTSSLLGHGTQNTVSATVKNVGTTAAGAFKVRFNVDGTITDVDVASLAAGASTTVSVADTVDRNAGVAVPITITADPNGAVADVNLINNALTTTATTLANGYAGHRWSIGDDITTKRIFDIHGDVVYSGGNGRYGGDTTAWTAADLPIPAGATIKDARLYVPYTWDNGGNMLGTTTMTFNGVVVPHESHYREEKGWGTWGEYPYGVFIFDVTNQFSKEGNTASFVHGYAPVRGMNLVVTYEDAGATEKLIFVNDGFDMLFAKPDYQTTPETATAYAPFTGAAIDMGRVTGATIITSISGGNGNGVMLFNGREWQQYWTTRLGDAANYNVEIKANSTDITPYLTADSNTVMVRSPYEGWGIEAYLAILRVEYGGPVAPAPVAVFTAAQTAPLTIRFTDASTGSPDSWSWDFGDNTTSDEQNPLHTYEAAGTYTVNLTVSNPTGSSEATQTISVSEDIPPVPEFPTVAFPVLVIGALAVIAVALRKK